MTKTFYYPVVKSILKFFGVSLTKNTFAKGVSKVIPVVGGVVSGGITLASMLPMGNRLFNTLDKAHFEYTMTDFETDMGDISKVCAIEVAKEKIAKSENVNEEKSVTTNSISQEEIFEKIQKAKQMFDNGVITAEEFSEIKAKLISQM